MGIATGSVLFLPQTLFRRHAPLFLCTSVKAPAAIVEWHSPKVAEACLWPRMLGFEIWASARAFLFTPVDARETGATGVFVFFFVAMFVLLKTSRANHEV